MSQNEQPKRQKKKLVSTDEEIRNPFYHAQGRIYLSDSKEEKDSLATLILKAIKNKVSKEHRDKESTILIIDNRTSKFEVKDYQKAVGELKDKTKNIPFPEIYFYTGYYSNNDGDNAEYSLAPIKLPDERYELIRKRIESGELNLDSVIGVAYDEI